jgi:hypothetical protein
MRGLVVPSRRGEGIGNSRCGVRGDAANFRYTEGTGAPARTPDASPVGTRNNDAMAGFPAIASLYAKGIMASMIANATSGPIIGKAPSKRRPNVDRVRSPIIAFLPRIAACVTRSELPRLPNEYRRNYPVIPDDLDEPADEARSKSIGSAIVAAASVGAWVSLRRVVTRAAGTSVAQVDRIRTQKTNMTDMIPPRLLRHQRQVRSAVRERKSHGT